MIPVGKSYPCDPQADAFLMEQSRQQQRERERERREREQERRQREQERLEQERRERERQEREAMLRLGFEVDMIEFAEANKNLQQLDWDCRNMGATMRRILNGTQMLLHDDSSNKVMMIYVRLDEQDMLVYDLYILQEITETPFFTLEGLQCVRKVSFEEKVTISDHSTLLASCDVTSLKFKKEAFIGEAAFSNLPLLGSVDFNEAAEISASAFFDCALLTLVNIWTSATIGANAFLGCRDGAVINFLTATLEIDRSTYNQLVEQGVIFRRTAFGIRAPLTFSLCLRL